MIFPAISCGPSEPYDISQSEAGDLKTPVEAGYKITRKIFTRAPKTWTTTYYPLIAADKDLLEPFIDSVGTTGNFDWTEPLSGAVKDVRFVHRPKLRRQGLVWRMDVQLEEV